MSAVMQIKYAPQWRGSLQRTMNRMTLPRLRIYSAWWRTRDAEVFNIITTTILLRKTDDAKKISE